MYNVLIVDDDTLMRNALRAMISRFKNFQIIGEAANGAEAIAICRLYPVHLIFMDIMMPVMDGLEATKEIRRLSRRDCQEIPIIAMSANAFAEDIINSHISGMNWHLTKPIDADKLMTALKECIRKNISDDSIRLQMIVEKSKEED